MFRKMIYLMFVVVISFGMSVTTNASVKFVGSDTITQSNWRTAAVLESDLEYGTDGYVIYGLNVGDSIYTDYDASSVYAESDNLVSLPAYIDDISLADTTGMWSGSGNFGQIEDPANGNALTNTPLLANGDPDPWVFTITRTTTEAFRLTVMLSNGDNVPSNWITTVDAGGSATHDFPVPDTSNATYYEVFDVPRGSGAVTVTVEYITDGSQFNLTGFAFDSASELASNPRPGDGEPNVPRDVVLNWSPGKFAAQHAVYFGTNFDDVNEADSNNSVVIQDANTYDPGQLEFGKKYYWRIDEVNNADPNSPWRGDVWSFEVEPVGYPIAGDMITATASSFNRADMGPKKTIDGSGLDDADQHGTEGADMWLSAESDQDIWIQYAFTKPQKLHQMWVWNSNQSIESIVKFGAKNVTIETSMDGTTWTTLDNVPEFTQASGFSDYTHNTVVDFGRVSAQYVKLTVNGGWGQLGQVGLSEVRFFAIPVYARQPQPELGASDQEPPVVLRWRAGRDAAIHDVYLGTDPNALTLAGQTSETHYTVSVALDQTHYWRVDEVNSLNPDSPWVGNLWSFTTGDFLIVDDFEDYNAGDNQIWYAWHDGLGYGAPGTDPYFVGNGTGAAVGDETTASYTEETIVHSGSQSMPYNYGQNGAAISEATLPIDAQDWSENEVRSLSLMFYGNPDNTPGQMYVGINGSRIVDYPGTPDDMKQSLWHTWQIDLQSHGITTVNSLTLGIEGGAGTIFVDDIRLYPLVPEYVTPVAPDNVSLVAHYTLDGHANDDSGNGADGVENGVPIFYEAGVEGQAIRLDGIDDFIDLGVPEHWPAGAAPRTLCAWAQTFSVEPGWRVIAGYGSPAGGEGTGLVMNGTSLYGSGYGSDVNIDNFWSVEEWHHVGLTYDGTTVRLYADGIEVVSGERDWNTIITVARIGRQVNEAREFWDGRVDEVHLYNRALSMAEMAWLAGRTAPVAKPF